ncbi:hypothetical protein ACAN107058_17680 [Paracidovorax anthurii]|uniref:Uncharacterized protein n=1 Tax=Paracidovorax anthurii TaxID=78229 RepID=A0A328YFI9_9BURK|nr:hypothetical protein AX018_108014 [Paracidovorax anthurii]
MHSVAYAPDDKFNTLQGKLSFNYVLALARGKHKIEPAQVRQSWAAAPAGLTLRTYEPQDIAKLHEHGASFVALPLPAFATGSSSAQMGKTIFRPADQIPGDLEKLCGD